MKEPAKEPLYEPFPDVPRGEPFGIAPFMTKEPNGIRDIDLSKITWSHYPDALKNMPKHEKKEAPEMTPLRQRAARELEARLVKWYSPIVNAYDDFLLHRAYRKAQRNK